MMDSLGERKERKGFLKRYRAGKIKPPKKKYIHDLTDVPYLRMVVESDEKNREKVIEKHLNKGLLMEHRGGKSKNE